MALRPSPPLGHSERGGAEVKLPLILSPLLLKFRRMGLVRDCDAARCCGRRGRRHTDQLGPS
jgi:hypothetical protein